jgi:branched-chain amino acid transport system permease protein
LLQFVIAGLVVGGIYALASSGLVITFVSAGVLNFAFGSIAYTVARTYYYLHVQHHWALLPSVLLCMFVLGPALGAFLFIVLFRHLTLASTLVKVVITIGLSVALPPIVILLFGDIQIALAPGIAPQPVHIFHVLGSSISMDQLLVYISVAAILGIGFIVLRFTAAGLGVRAMVDSPAMTSLSGGNPFGISLVVWMVSTFLAGVCGMLLAPIIGLSAAAFTQLIAAAFAAVVAARLRNLGVAIAVSFAIGIAGSVLQYWLPPASTLTTAVLPSVPFVFIVVFLVYHIVRAGRVSEGDGVGGALDRAILPQGGARLGASAEPATGGDVDPRIRKWAPIVGFAFVLILPNLLHPFWVGLMAQAVAVALFMLSYTLVTGEGGMLWLSQITFAGIGALVAAQLATRHGWPVLLAALASALLVAVLGTLLGLVTLRLGDVYVALVTLTAGLLVEGLVFTRPVFLQQGVGVVLSRPKFANSDKAFVYLGLAAVIVVSLLIVNVRRSTAGLALNAVRWSETGARTLGISVVQMKLLVAGLAAFVAGLGGAFMAMQTKVALGDNFSVYFGFVLLTVLVTIGVRSCFAAVVAGLSFVMLPQLLEEWLSPKFIQFAPILFGIGAIQLAKHPNGVMVEQMHENGRKLTRLVRRWSGQAPGQGQPQAAEQPEQPATVAS